MICPSTQGIPMPDGGTKPSKDQGTQGDKPRYIPAPAPVPSSLVALALHGQGMSHCTAQVPLCILEHGGGLKSTLRLNKSTFLQEPQM